MRDVELLRKGHEDLDLGGEAHFYDDIPQKTSFLSLSVEGLFELVLSDHLVFD